MQTQHHTLDCMPSACVGSASRAASQGRRPTLLLKTPTPRQLRPRRPGTGGRRGRCRTIAMCNAGCAQSLAAGAQSAAPGTTPPGRLLAHRTKCARCRANHRPPSAASDKTAQLARFGNPNIVRRGRAAHLAAPPPRGRSGYLIKQPQCTARAGVMLKQGGAGWGAGWGQQETERQDTSEGSRTQALAVCRQ